jgi:hydrogenase maturation protease
VKVLLVAVGNPLNGDDGFGPLVLECLRTGAQLKAGVTLVDAGTDLLNHIESFLDYDRVVLIDAVLDPEGKLASPGRVVILEEEFFSTWSEQSQGVHQMSPLLGIKLFRTLHPEAQVKIHLAGLIVDQLTHTPIYMTDKTIAEAGKTITKFISEA